MKYPSKKYIWHANICEIILKYLKTYDYVNIFIMFIASTGTQ